VSEPPSEYDRGVTAGGIEARLANHDRHFEVINGSIVDGKNATVGLREEIHQLRLAIQQLADQAKASAEAAIKTALALKEADEARRNSADQRWSPWQKGFAVIAAVGVLVGLYFALRG
jgi:hypothetical protein